MALKSTGVSNGLRLAAQGTSEDWELALEHQVDVPAFARREANLDNARIYPLAAGFVLSSDGAVTLGQVVIGVGLSKLLRLKDWLTVPKAARDLSILVGEDVTEADVLQFALEGRLTLSVRLVNRVTARPGKIIPPADAKIVEVKDVFGNTYQRIEEGVDLGNDRMLPSQPKRASLPRASPQLAWGVFYSDMIAQARRASKNDQH